MQIAPNYANAVNVTSAVPNCFIQFCTSHGTLTDLQLYLVAAQKNYKLLPEVALLDFFLIR